MENKCSFKPIFNSWVAIHSKPKGVLYFVGGAFFGTYPLIFYSYFFRKLFEERYTVIALPYVLGVNHWKIAENLLKERQRIQPELSKIAKNLGYERHIYEDSTRTFWLGHSIGCKLIALIEFLSDEQASKIARECFKEVKDNKDNLEIFKNKNIQEIDSICKDISIKNETSLLMAPVLKAPFFIDPFIRPSKENTKCLIKASSFFNLTAIIAFSEDETAGNKTNKNQDVYWFIHNVLQPRRRYKKFFQQLPYSNSASPCYHLEPLGTQVGNYIIRPNVPKDVIKSIDDRELEEKVIQFLDKKQFDNSNSGY